MCCPSQEASPDFTIKRLFNRYACSILMSRSKSKRQTPRPSKRASGMSKKKVENAMAEFELPHHHGAHAHMEYIRRELGNVEHFAAVSEVFKQLSDPTRARIFWLLSHQEECVVNIAALLDMSSPAVFHHLRSLTESGLLVSRRDGKEVYYSLAANAYADLVRRTVTTVFDCKCTSCLNAKTGCGKTECNRYPK